MDPSLPEATAVAVQGDVIVSVGSLESLRPWLERENIEVVIDRTFEDMILVPGFIDPHVHALIAGTALTLPSVAPFSVLTDSSDQEVGSLSKSSIIRLIRNYHQRQEDPEGALLCWGYDAGIIGSHLDKHDLDSVSSTRPIAVWDFSMQNVGVNTAFMKTAGLTKKSVRHWSGVGISNDGTLSGQFMGADTSLKTLKAVIEPMMTPERCYQSLQFIVDLARRNGVTTLSELAMGKINYNMESRLLPLFFDDGVPMRCAAVASIRDVLDSCRWSSMLALRELRRLKASASSHCRYESGLQLYSDDTCLGFNKIPEDISPGSRIGLDSSAYIQKILPFWISGYRFHLYPSYLGNQTNSLRILTDLQKSHPRFDHRTVFEHYGLSDLSIARRVHALGGCVSFNVFYSHNNPEYGDHRHLCGRAYLASQVKSLMELNIPCAMHSDVPVAPPKPLQEISLLSSSNSIPDDSTMRELKSEECVSIYDAIKMKTIDAAYVLGIDHSVGSIEAGKFADFAVLDANPLDAHQAQIREVCVWGTIVGGKKFPLISDWSPRQKPPSGYIPGMIWLYQVSSEGLLSRFFWNLAHFMNENRLISGIGSIVAMIGSSWIVYRALRNC